MSDRIPSNTYRLQITAQFDLYAAAERVPLLHELGVDWVYLSPLLAAEEGSDHGYDVVAHDHIDPARGGPDGLAALSAAAHERDMGVLVDIVPNHVGIAVPSHDPWWWDVLRLGRESTHANAFDVDWNAGHERIQIPVVGDDDLRPDGHIEHLSVDVGAGELRYHDNVYPLAPGSADDLGEPITVNGVRSMVDADLVHSRQHYELVGWRRADDALNYRRFFAVNTLAAVRVEDPQVFAETHVEISRWFRDGLVDGLRVDHPDGLRDPAGYLADLADLTGGAYVLVEKILEPGETLPAWRTAGTTGYDALALVDRLFVDPAGQPVLDDLETDLRGAPVDWPELVHDRKRAVADGILRSEVKRIVRELRRHLPVVPAFRAEDAVAELMACFEVYRSYLPDGSDYLDRAFAEAARRRPDLGPTLTALRHWLSNPDLAATKRFQQTSGMVMAKGVEDCAFYRWSRLTSLNEVGADPSQFSISIQAFHDAMEVRHTDWPAAMTALSTHDTKRGEDVRARISVLAEMPDLWAETLGAILAAHQHRTGSPTPDPGFASLLIQAALGAWPITPDRLHAYATKAMREAGEHTGWTDIDQTYEDWAHDLVSGFYDLAGIRGPFEALVETIAPPGWVNSLGAKLVALTMPGVPDIYQGSELWEQSLVDPDNRRPVDFDRRAAMLARLDADPGRIPSLGGLDDDGLAKLLVTSRAARVRRDRPDLFTGYAGLTATGPAADHLIAFDRGGAITLATRLPLGLAAGGGWRDTVLDLPAGRWREVFTGRLIGVEAAGTEVAGILADLPVALLVKEGE
ncbi:malto-oligosyltrehalose synthase [soil metagenome]